MSKTGTILFFIAAVLFITGTMRCTSNDFGGNSTQVGNGMIAGILYKPDGSTPARGAFVSVRKKSTLADVNDITPLVKSTDTRVTDNNGRFTIDSIDTGLYIIEGSDGGNNVILFDSVFVQCSDSTIILPPATLRPAGAVRGVIRLSEGGDPRKVFIRAFGLDRFAIADSNGHFMFERLAEGTYHLQFMPLIDNYGIYDTSGIPVTSSDTFDIGTVGLEFIGLPKVVGLAIAYDTLSQQVHLAWNRLTARKVTSFNIYRRAIDPTTAIFFQVNLFPFVDTFFIDSVNEQNASYEYRVTAVDSTTVQEGAKSDGVTVRIALYDIVPQSIGMIYDTIMQTVTLQWSNPDSTRVTGYNVYRRNITTGEIFWTPFNNTPFADTFFVDSTFQWFGDADQRSEDSSDAEIPSYEYCVTCFIRGFREGKRSTGLPVWICQKYLIPANLRCTYNTLRQSVRIMWSRPDMTIVNGFAVLRKSLDINDAPLLQINDGILTDTLYTDSTCDQNMTYEYHVVALIKKGRALVMGTGTQVRLVAAFTIDTVYHLFGSATGQLQYPNDITVGKNGDIYIVDQGNKW